MHKSKLVTLLRTLTVSEMRDFGKFMEGTSYRTTGAIFQLYNFLKKQHPEYPDKKIDREYVKKALNKGGKNTGNRLPDLVSLLNTELEKFLIQKKLFEKEIRKEMLFLEVLRERGLDKMFFKRAANLEKNWGDYRGEGIEDLHTSFLLSRAEITHPNREEDRVQKNKELLERLDNYYLTTKLHYCSSLLSNTVDFASDDSNAEFLDQQFLLKQINASLLEKDAIGRPEMVNISHLILMGYLSSVEDYDTVKTQILDNFQLFNETEQHDYFIFLQRVCIQKMNSGEELYLRELFEVYKIMVSSGNIYKDEFIPAVLFRSMILVACSLSELEWAKDFLEQNYRYAKKEYREDIYSLCAAIILFHERKFEESISCLDSVRFTDVAYALQARVILLQCHYELEDQDLFFNMVRSFGSFLDRNNLLSEELKEDVRKFINYANSMMRIKFDPNETIDHLLEKFSKERRVFTQIWLSSKMDELKKPKT